MENYNQAITDFDKVIKLDPNNAAAYQFRGICCEALGNRASAQIDFTTAKALGYE